MSGDLPVCTRVPEVRGLYDCGACGAAIGRKVWFETNTPNEVICRRCLAKVRLPARGERDEFYDV